MQTLTRRRFGQMLALGTLAAGAGSLGAAWRAPGRTLVIGGGPAGAAAALALRAAEPRNPVVLIERDPTRLARAQPGATAFDRPAAGVDLARLRQAGVEVVIDDVVDVDWQAARLALFSARDLAFDRLVLAPGTAPQDEPIAGLDARARYLWPAAWGNAREARRLAAQLAALPARGHVVLRLPAGAPSHPAVALARAQALAGYLAAHAPQARLTVLDGSPDENLASRAETLGLARQVQWHRAPAGGTVLGLDANAGLIETNAGPLHADVVNFVPPQRAGTIAQLAGLADASGWCPCDDAGRSALRPETLILGDARKGALRTRDAARQSAQGLRDL